MNSAAIAKALRGVRGNQVFPMKERERSVLRARGLIIPMRDRGVWVGDMLTRAGEVALSVLNEHEVRS